MLPSDVQIWEAVALPKSAKFIPNCCICSRLSAGCVALGGGGYDGDLLNWSANKELFQFLEFTRDGCNLPEVAQARALVEDQVVQIPPMALPSCTAYRHLSTPRRHFLVPKPTTNATGSWDTRSETWREFFLKGTFFFKLCLKKCQDGFSEK